jgi:hypothetical protein
MLREVKVEIVELITNLAFARNLSLTMIMAIAILFGLAKLRNECPQLNISNSASTKVIILRH